MEIVLKDLFLFLYITIYIWLHWYVVYNTSMFYK